MPNHAVLELLTAITLRAALFFSCRKFLLRSLYHDLQDLSSDEVHHSGHIGTDSEFELDTLPAPSTSGLPGKSDTTDSTRKNVSLHSTLGRSLFSLSFSECCVMFLMLMSQGVNMFHPHARMLNWKLSLFMLLAIILVFIPVSLSLVLTMGPTSDRPHKRPMIVQVVLSLAPVILYLYLLSRIPLPDALVSSDVMTIAISRLVVLGTIILGLLSGFGAVSSAWAFFPLFSCSRFLITEGDIATAEKSLLRVREDLSDRRATLQRHVTTKPKVESTWLTRVIPTFRNDSSSEFGQEVKGLEALEYQMSRDFARLKDRHENARFSRTFKGKMFNWGGRLFAIYCVFRVTSSVINLLTPAQKQDPGSSYPDLITHLLAYLFSLVPSIGTTIEDVAAISRQISLALVGVIILSSVRRVLRGVTRALRVTSRNLGASLMLLILAQLMGIYLLSTIVQLRTSFPPLPTRPDLDNSEINLFSTIPEYELFGSLFDGSFLLSAGVSIFGRWAGERVNGLRDG